MKCSADSVGRWQTWSMSWNGFCSDLCFYQEEGAELQSWSMGRTGAGGVSWKGKGCGLWLLWL